MGETRKIGQGEKRTRTEKPRGREDEKTRRQGDKKDENEDKEMTY